MTSGMPQKLFLIAMIAVVSSFAFAKIYRIPQKEKASQTTKIGDNYICTFNGIVNHQGPIERARYLKRQINKLLEEGSNSDKIKIIKSKNMSKVFSEKIYLFTIAEDDATYYKLPHFDVANLCATNIKQVLSRNKPLAKKIFLVIISLGLLALLLYYIYFCRYDSDSD